mgnify:CR=1 FL=1
MKAQKVLLGFNKNEQHKLLVQQNLDNDGELAAGEYESLYNDFKEQRERFIEGTKTDRALIKRDLNMSAEAVKMFKTFRQDLSAAFNTKQLMKGWSYSAQGGAIMDLLKDEPRLTRKKYPNGKSGPDKDQIGVILPNFDAVRKAHGRIRDLDTKFNSLSPEDKKSENINKDYQSRKAMLQKVIDTNGEQWTSISNLKQFVKLQDEASRKTISNMGNNYLSQSSKTNPADNVPFNRAAAERQVRSNIVNASNNKQSLVYDEMITNRTFWNDMFNKLRTMYNNEDDVRRIADNIVHNPLFEKELDNELTDYFVNHLEKQWNMGKGNRPNPANIDQSKKQPSNENVEKPIRYKPGIIAASMKS